MDFKNPVEAMKAIAQIDKDIHLTIEKKIKDLLDSFRPLTRVLVLEEDAFLGYPRVYSDDAHCSIPQLKRITVNNAGRIHLTTGKHTHLRKPHCENLSVGELLQIWDIAIKATETEQK